MPKHTKTQRTDNQTASEEQTRVAGVLHESSDVYDPEMSLLSGNEKLEFDWGETVHPDNKRTQDTY